MTWEVQMLQCKAIATSITLNIKNTVNAFILLDMVSTIWTFNQIIEKAPKFPQNNGVWHSDEQTLIFLHDSASLETNTVRFLYHHQ